jgi:hypothetical protein
VSDEDFVPSENSREAKISIKYLNGSDDGRSAADLLTLVDGTDLSTSVSAQTADNKDTTRQYSFCSHSSNIPTAKTLCGRQTTRKKIAVVSPFI